MIGMRTLTKIGILVDASPFAVFYGGLGVFLLFSALFMKKSPWLKIIFFNLSFLCLGVSLSDAGYGRYQKWKAPQGESQATGTYWEQGYFTPDSVRGYAMGKALSVQSKLVVKDQLIYNATYSSDRQGLRQVPARIPFNASSPKKFFFFGCSFTFGEGLSDHETLAAKVQELSQGNLHSKNFAFHGYGPHQLLAILESGQEKVLAEIKGHDKVIGAVFQTITGHVDRAMGFSSWEETAPHYTSNSKGALQKKDVRESKSLLRKLKRSAFLASSPLLRDFATELDKFYVKRNLKQGQLTTAIIIKKAQDLFIEKYNAPLLTIVWPSGVGEGDSERFRSYLKDLKDTGVNAVAIDEVIPDYFKQIQKYHLPVDGHPNAEANLQVAKYLQNRYK